MRLESLLGGKGDGKMLDIPGLERGSKIRICALRRQRDRDMEGLGCPRELARKERQVKL